MKTLVILDYGMSNLHSVQRALEHVAGKAWRVMVTADHDTIMAADKVVFPGQGAMGNCMQLLRDTGLDTAIRDVIGNKPFLGICLGLQTLLSRSEESGGTAGFGVIEGVVRRFPEGLSDPNNGEKLKIPHMGWNRVEYKGEHPLWKGIEDNSRFYFVHSYYADPDDKSYCAASTDYGLSFTSAAAHENIFAVQFHPEKSQHAGLTLLQNFLDW